ncbi:hypothetical protein POPTR_007G086250v4 [Populus trichocarpa]|uniref:Uncharacterized protein n=1 Tax=Populus trichocarpa TaxID=3694 RepID=A0ACC0SQA7_POPTR|nr:hypothetical protein POPTR_007G086250v4 [Populus trichocarpa]
MPIKEKSSATLYSLHHSQPFFARFQLKKQPCLHLSSIHISLPSLPIIIALSTTTKHIFLLTTLPQQSTTQTSYHRLLPISSTKTHPKMASLSTNNDDSSSSRKST